MIKTTLEIEGMSCGMCESHINDVIRRNFDIKSVKSSHKQNKTEIVSKAPLDEAKLKKAIAGTGYRLLSVKSEEYVKQGLFTKQAR